MSEEKVKQTILDSNDLLLLELSKYKRMHAAAQYEMAELNHKNFVLQLYLKYNLKMEEDAINESGEILHGYKVKEV